MVNRRIGVSNINECSKKLSRIQKPALTRKYTEKSILCPLEGKVINFNLRGIVKRIIG